MDIGTIKLPKIYANPYFILLLLFLNYHWTHPIRLLDGFNNTCVKHLVQLQVDFFLVFGIKAIWPLLDRLRVQFQIYFHYSQIAYDAFQVRKFCTEQILVFVEQLSDFIYCIIIPLIPNLHKLQLCLCANVYLPSF